MRRILFLAMSGVRVHDASLRELGLTLPGFVERGNVIASLPSLSLLTLAAHTPPEWEVEYREVEALDARQLAQLESGAYSLIAISALSPRILETYALADRLRAAGQKVVLGGLHVSALPAEAQPHADAIVQGEGERCWPELLGDLERGALKPLYSSRAEPRLRHRLEEARVPRYELLELRRYNRLTLQTSRGCPLDCTFCGASRLISRYQRKPLPLIRRELEAILSLWPRPFLELADDNTFVDRAWSRGLAELLGEYQVPWFTETDISVADDEALLEALARSGCAQLLVGLEATDAPLLQAVDGRAWKRSRVESYLEKVRLIQSYGISVNGCFIFGFDGQDAGAFERTRAFVEESDLSEVQITLLTPFPGTALHRQLAEEGRLLSPVYWERCTLFDPTFVPRGMTLEELTVGFRKLMGDLYNPAATSRRSAQRRKLLRVSARGRRSSGKGDA